MNRRSLISWALVAALIILGAGVPVAAKSPRHITGHWELEDINPVTGAFGTGKFTIHVVEVNPVTHEARGYYRFWFLYEGVVYQQAVDVNRVIFSDTDPSEATFSGPVTLTRNWPEEITACFAYGKGHVRDGGTPGSGGDEFGVSWGDCFPVGYTCDPCGDPEECPTEGIAWWPVVRGNITVHR